MASLFGWGRSNEMDAFQDLVERFDRLLGSCDQEMVAFSECLNREGLGRRRGGAGAGRSSACAGVQKAMYDCQGGREVMHGRVMASCGALYQGYEDCMRTNAANPGACMGSLVKLFQCAEGARAGQ